MSLLPLQRIGRRPTTVVLLLLLTTRCDCGDDPPGSGDAELSDGEADDANLVGDGSTVGADGQVLTGDGGPRVDGGTISRLEYCEGSGPPIIIGDQGGTMGDVCTGEIAQVTFRYAICSCNSPVGTDELETDAFDSSQGPYAPGGRGGAVGTNGSYTATGLARIGGALWVSGSGASQVTNDHTILGELRVQGDLTVADMSVDRSAYVGGDVVAQSLDITGDLHIPESSNITGTVNAASTIREPVNVTRPCACEPSELVDIAGFIAAHEQQNDNAEIGLDPNVLAEVNTATVVALPCGRFFLSEISGTAPIRITIEDRTALFIAGDVTTTGVFELELAPGAEVDVFIGGDFTATDELELGSAAAPAKARLYIGGDGDVTLTNKALLAGNVYAPRAEVVVTDALEVFGSLFAGKLTFTNKLTVHYDRAVLEAGEGCMPPEPSPADAGVADGGGPEDTGAPPQMCSDCNDCGNQACVAGACGACTTSEQCCSPLVCANGVCLPDF